jgi:hypothetical protein
MTTTHGGRKWMLAGFILFAFPSCSGEQEIGFETLRFEVLAGSLSPKEVQVIGLSSSFDDKTIKELVMAIEIEEGEEEKRICLEFKSGSRVVGLTRPDSFSFDRTLPEILVGDSDNGGEFLTAFSTCDQFEMGDTLMFQNYFKSFSWGSLAIPSEHIGELVWSLSMDESLPLSVLNDVIEELSRNGVKYVILTQFRVSERASLHG